MPRDTAIDWAKVQANGTYWEGALDDAEGRAIKWHSPTEPKSSQVFCISAFGGLRRLPDGPQILGVLLGTKFSRIPCEGPWDQPIFEHTDRGLLAETGRVTPTSVDVFCTSPRTVVCVESKFLFDAAEGFGGCGQVKSKKAGVLPSCAGYYGPGSDLKTRSRAHCRLEIQNGTRGPRLYWSLGREYFSDRVFRVQNKGEVCSFAGPNFQLMRNFLFAAAAASVAAKKQKTQSVNFAVLAMVPNLTSANVRQQVDTFRDKVLRDPYRDNINLATYDELTGLLSASHHEQSRALGRFLDNRMRTLL